jgi:propanol-preferring alcohol dehydrogenase
MKAALLMEYGKPLKIADVPRPIPKADEVLVKIEASGVCFTDVHILKGEHASLTLKMDGAEASGLYIATEASVTSQ